MPPDYSIIRKGDRGYAHCSLTGNKNYPAITKLTNTMKGYATSSRGQPYILSMSNVDR